MIILAIISALAAIITVADFVRVNLKESPKQLVYPVLIVILTIVATFIFQENHELKNIKKEAKTLADSFPKIEKLEFATKGERIGIILSGMSFLEKYRERFPETYTQAKNLIESRVDDFKEPKDYDESLKEYGLLEDVTGAMIKVINSISK